MEDDEEDDETLMQSDRSFPEEAKNLEKTKKEENAVWNNLREKKITFNKAK